MSTTTKMILPPPPKHECWRYLPNPSQYEYRTLARCTCGRWSRVGRLGFEREWFPVRWHHFRLRRRIREHS